MDVCNNQSLVALLSAHCYPEQYDILDRSTSEIESDQRPIITTIESSNSVEIQGQETANKIQLQVSKQPGRPRLDAPHTAVLTPNRRKQVRRAQETFRLKKKAALESHKTRVAELEARIDCVADLFSEFHDVAIQSGLENTHPILYDYLLRMRSHLSLKDGVIDLLSIHKPGTENLTPGKNTAQVRGSDNVLESSSTFGYQVSNESWGKPVYPSNEYTHIQKSPMRGHYSRPTVDGETILRPALSQNIEWPLKGSATSTYSFHETTFARRLHRYCLEHSYRLFIDKNSDPAIIYRIFRLVPCIQNKDKMLPYFQRLVQGGLSDVLEIATLPFYCIGGAGTHHRQNDEIGHPIYPLNSRLPKRLLGIVPTKTTRGRTLSVDYKKHLKTFGLDGEWFDCQDVEGYLQQRGTALNQISPAGEICITRSHCSTHSSHYLAQSTQRVTRNDILAADSGACKNLSLDVDDTQAGMKTRSTVPIASRRILDVDLFLTRLLDGLVMLGRAPGFKQSQVEAAFMSSLRIQA